VWRSVADLELPVPALALVNKPAPRASPPVGGHIRLTDRAGNCRWVSGRCSCRAPVLLSEVMLRAEGQPRRGDASGSSPYRGALPVDGDHSLIADDPGIVPGWQRGDFAGNDLELGAVLHGDMQAT
jgi:hypothetical protein